jgi:PAS domain S-box-containing protein
VIELVIEAMVDAVVVVDADGRISLANSGAEGLTGYSRDELRGMPIGMLLLDESSGLRSVVRRRIEDGSVLRREDAWLIARGEQRIPVSVTGSPVIDEHGALHGIVVVARDVREQRQLLSDKEAEIARRRDAEDQLRAAHASVERQLDQTRTMLLLAERRATLGTLAGGVGHELRNIAQVQVAAIDELATALDKNEPVDGLVRQLLPELQRVGEHITLHGDKLLQLARPGPDHVAPIDLNAIARDVGMMLKLAGKLRHVELVLALAPEPLRVTVNRARIEQILVNLVSNAVDAISDRAGTVTITTSACGERRVRCRVRDTGSGIARDHLNRIFEPFFTTKPPDRGTGLGLTVVREIVLSYDGSIDVASEPGVGTTFTFELPG